MSSSSLPVARKDKLIIKELPDETLVYDSTSNKAYCLNQTASFVWKSCNGANQPIDIARLLEIEFKATVSEDLVWLAVQDLSKNNLLDEQNSFSQPANSLSRRAALRGVGLATAIALPVVVSLVVPPAASAASVCGCTGPGDCITQTSCTSQVNCNPSLICAP